MLYIYYRRRLRRAIAAPPPTLPCKMRSDFFLELRQQVDFTAEITAAIFRREIINRD